MSETPHTDELLKAFPEWTETEEELWLEIYSQMIPLLIGARLDPESPERKAGVEYEDRLEAGKSDVMMAAEIADAAVEEMQMRFSIQRQQKTRQRGRAKSQYQARRTKRLESKR